MLSITNVYLFILGWHHRANAKAGHRSCSFYRLCPLLLQEAQLVETRVSSDNLCRDVRRSTSATQKKLEEAWNRYDVGEISTGHFLRLCAVPSTCPASKCDGTVSLWSLCLCDTCSYDVIPLCWTAREMWTVTWMMLMLLTFIEFISFWKLNKINY